jgi:hypothetical protein
MVTRSKDPGPTLAAACMICFGMNWRCPALPALSHLLAVELHLHLTRADLHDDG